MSLLLVHVSSFLLEESQLRLNKKLIFGNLDISDIKFVINIDYPTQTEDYVHRIGRTARNSNTGTAFTLITSDNAKHVPKLIEILREANQQVSQSLLSLIKNNSSAYRNGPSRYQSKF